MQQAAASHVAVLNVLELLDTLARLRECTASWEQADRASMARDCQLADDAFWVYFAADPSCRACAPSGDAAELKRLAGQLLESLEALFRRDSSVHAMVLRLLLLWSLLESQTDSDQSGVLTAHLPCEEERLLGCLQALLLVEEEFALEDALLPDHDGGSGSSTSGDSAPRLGLSALVELTARLLAGAVPSVGAAAVCERWLQLGAYAPAVLRCALDSTALAEALGRAARDAIPSARHACVSLVEAAAALGQAPPALRALRLGALAQSLFAAGAWALLIRLADAARALGPLAPWLLESHAGGAEQHALAHACLRAIGPSEGAPRAAAALALVRALLYDAAAARYMLDADLCGALVSTLAKAGGAGGGGAPSAEVRAGLLDAAAAVLQQHFEAVPTGARRAWVAVLEPRLCEALLPAAARPLPRPAAAAVGSRRGSAVGLAASASAASASALAADGDWCDRAACVLAECVDAPADRRARLRLLNLVRRYAAERAGPALRNELFARCAARARPGDESLAPSRPPSALAGSAAEIACTEAVPLLGAPRYAAAHMGAGGRPQRHCCALL